MAAQCTRRATERAPHRDATRATMLRRLGTASPPPRPYEVGSSRCLDLPGYRSHDAYPMRSPLVAADFLVDQLKAATQRQPGRAASYLEVGTRDGDNIACVAQLAQTMDIHAHATAVEQSPRRCAALRSRSAAARSRGAGGRFHVVETQVNDSTAHALPTADVYYYWGLPATNLQMIRWMDEAARAHGVRSRAPALRRGPLPARGGHARGPARRQ